MIIGMTVDDPRVRIGEKGWDTSSNELAQIEGIDGDVGWLGASFFAMEDESVRRCSGGGGLGGLFQSLIVSAAREGGERRWKSR
jgi:hypothetical protein